METDRIPGAGGAHMARGRKLRVVSGLVGAMLLPALAVADFTDPVDMVVPTTAEVVDPDVVPAQGPARLVPVPPP
jgi:hypothetical protein